MVREAWCAVAIGSQRVRHDCLSHELNWRWKVKGCLWLRLKLKASSLTNRCCCSVAKWCLTLCDLTAAYQAPLSFTIFQSLLKLMFIESVMPSNHLILCYPPFSSCPQSFPASGSFPMSWPFAPGDQSVGASAAASVLPVNIQG